MLQKLEFRPGIVRERTEYANSGGWFDADKVRFRAGHPEKIGGWAAVTREPFKGTCRALHQWSSVEFDRYVGLGTNEKLYILWGNSYYDITPVRATQTLAGPADICVHGIPHTLSVHAPLHGMTLPGDWFTLSNVTTPVGPFTPAMLNGPHQATVILDKDNFLFEASGADATAPGGCGGGTGVVVEYKIPSGLDVALLGTGWGIPPWGGGNSLVPGPLPPGMPPDEIPQPHTGPWPPYPPGLKWSGWGMGFDPRILNPVGFDVNQIRLWDMDNFGEDLVANIRHGPIYYWHQASGVGSLALPLSQEVTIAGVTYTPIDVPDYAAQVLVSPNDRHLIALGCNFPGANEPDPLLIRWSDEEDAYNWRPLRENSAGDQRLSSGSYIISGLRTRQEILIWTDLGLWSMKYIGVPYTFGFDVIAEGLSIIGPNAAVNAGNLLCWMDRGIFYVYTGQVQELPCPLKDYIFNDMNFTQQYKVFAGHNHAFSEVMWFYPSEASDEIDRYVIYNYVDQCWSMGKLDRTAWLDMGRSNYPIAARALTRLLYYHELGEDDDGDALAAYIESSDVDIESGDHFLFVTRVIPDVLFRGNGQQQTVGLSLLKRGAALGMKEVGARIEVNPNSTQTHVRLRGRQISLRVESTHLGVGWRLGTVRADIQLDGKR